MSEQDVIRESLEQERAARQEAERQLEARKHELDVLKQDLQAVTSNLEQVIRYRTLALTEARDDALEASRAKTEFLSSMSHELRTPLNAIIGFSELLMTDHQEPLSEMQKDSVLEISKAGQHLLDLINDILDMARIESGKIKLEMGEVELWPLIDECLTGIQPLAEKQGIEISAADNLRPQGIRVHADHLRLKQALINLLSNAIKYNRESGSVHVRTDLLDTDDVRILVEDTGIGISPEDIETIFEAFSRVGEKMNEVEGTGVGLSLTRRLVEGMGGEIGVDSKLNIGSHFWIDIPASQAAAIPESVPRHETGVFPLLGSFDRTVLYVEDNPANRRLVEAIFRQIPYYRLILADSGREGIEAAILQKPDIVVTDIQMPGVDGNEVLRILKKNRATASLPVIALSANARPEDVRKGLEAGFDDYLVKPIRPKQLIRALNLFFDKK